MYDPRPLEPAWVSEPECPDTAEWVVTRRKWNKETRKHDLTKAYGEGSMGALLRAVADIIKSADPECEIQIDASNMAERIDRPARLADYGIDLGNVYLSCLAWKIDPSGILDDVGTDLYELLDSIQYLAEKGEKFTVDLEYDDPTPWYSEIGSMF